MLKALAIASIALLTVGIPAYADEDLTDVGWGDTSTDSHSPVNTPTDGDQGDIKHTTGTTGSLRYKHSPAGSNSFSPQSNSSAYTGNQGRSILPTTSGTILPFSGLTGGPIAPGNLSYMTQHKSPIGGRLPETRLDSFVHTSGRSDAIYGNEGRQGPPRRSSFQTIFTGFDGKTKKDLTTGHQSELPSSWY